MKAIVLLAAVFVVSCGSMPPQSAYFAVQSARDALYEADDMIAPRYTAAAVVALQNPSTAAEVMEPWNRAESALRQADDAVGAADAALRAWEAARDPGSWKMVAACAALAMRKLTEALSKAQPLPMSGSAIEAMSRLSSVAGGERCL